MVEGVLGKARVERADVEGVVQVDALRLAASARSAAWDRVRRPQPAPSPTAANLREHGVDGRMLVLEREQQTGQAPQRAGGGDGLRQRLLTESGRLAFPLSLRHVPLAPFLANLYRIARYCMG